jgi:hypothetical protein
MTTFRLILLGVLLLMLAGLRLLSVGKKRGTPAYRWRMALWAASLTVAAAAGVVSVSPPAAGESVSMGDIPFQEPGGPSWEVVPSAQEEEEAILPADSAPAEVEPSQMISCYCTVAPTSRW